MVEKKRLDVAVFEMGIAESREKAKALIMSGQIYVDNQKADKVGMTVKEDSVIELRGKKMAYVSRGGYKLEKAMQSFPISLDGCICMDVGASTGGFTDCMLQNGAVKVYSVDVGYGQLAWSLRSDERVINLERTNFRYITEEQVPDRIDFASVDVSFISLDKILPVLFNFLKDGASAVCLVKPQFEAGRELVGKKGVVREKSTHAMVIKKATDNAVNNGFEVMGLDYSPIKGPEGNIEFLMYITKGKSDFVFGDAYISKLVDDAHNALDKGEQK